MSASEIVNKVWNYAHVLRDDGVGYGDYVEHERQGSESNGTYLSENCAHLLVIERSAAT